MKSSGNDFAHLDLAVLTNSISRNAGGMFFSVREPRLELQRHGFNLAVFGIQDAFTSTDILHWAPLVVTAFPSVGPKRFGFSPQLGKAIAGVRADVLHLHGLWTYASILAAKWAKKHGSPLVVSPHGMLDPWTLTQSHWRKLLAMRLFENDNLRNASCIHALNRSEADAIRNLGYTNAVAIIPNGVPIRTIRDGARNFYGHAKRSELLFLGRLHKKKGILQLIEAWYGLKFRSSEVIDKWKLIIAGWNDGEFEQLIHAKIKEHNLADDVDVIGPVFGDAKTKALANAGAFILPSFSEGLPIAVLEAWSAGLPVFMTRECNLADSFAHGVAIEISNEPTHMADTLEHFLLKGSVLESVGLAGRRYVDENYGWPKVSDDYVKLYRWLCGRERRPDFVI